MVEQVGFIMPCSKGKCAPWGALWDEKVKSMLERIYYRIWAFVGSFQGRSNEMGDHPRLGAIRTWGHCVVGYLSKCYL